MSPMTDWGDYTPGPYVQEGGTISKPGAGVIARCPNPNVDGVFAFIDNARLISKAYLIPRLEEALAMVVHFGQEKGREMPAFAALLEELRSP